MSGKSQAESAANLVDIGSNELLSSSMQIVIATRNPGKFREISQIIGHPSLELLCLSDLAGSPAVAETSDTFEENALLKAQSAAYHAGGWALADDSGLVIPALGGEPGIRSARFAGDNAADADNVRKVLELLRETPDNRRQAEFVCCIALVGTNNRAFFTEGRLAGTIAREPRGANGFGYDPVFLLPDGRTAAELSPGEKNAISHRTIALRKMVPLLRSLAEGTMTAC